MKKILAMLTFLVMLIDAALIFLIQPYHDDNGLDALWNLLKLSWLPVLIVTLCVASFYYIKYIDKRFFKTLKFAAFSVLAVYPLLIIQTGIGYFGLNAALGERSNPIQYSGKIQDKQTSYITRAGTRRIFVLAVESGTRSFDVTKREYQEHEIGDPFTIRYYRGYFGIQWRVALIF